MSHTNLTNGLPDLALGRAGQLALDNARPRLERLALALHPLVNESYAAAACLSAARALNACVLFGRQQGEGARALFNSRRAEIERAQEMLRIDASAQSLDTQRAGKFHEAKAVRDHANAMKADADALAEKAASAMRNAKLEVERAVTDADGPAALATGASMGVEDYARVNSLRAELASMAPSRIRGFWLSYVNTDEALKERDLTIAVGPILDEISKGGALALAKRLGKPAPMSNSATIDKELKAALQLKGEIARRREALVPEATRVAMEAYSELKGVYGVVLGFHASMLNRAELNRRFGSGRGLGDDALDVHPAWTERHLIRAGATK